MIRPLLLGLLHTLMAALIQAAILGVLFYATPLSEAWLPLLAMVVLALAIFWGALQAARLAGSRGLFQGLGVALLFILVLVALSWTGGTLTVKALAQKLGLSLLAGAMGGIAGVTGR
ncbi:putative membrane protein, TIGR04086 family [Thermanaeromonas toyohensis ToBE]|uniref:Putative membrane protein, TIGR04086 family n=1 Tax=Thermanaeromonas toyohensis ToBE TaxID=698762 RepID=A0A1W1VXC0_9FIRM|nr:TIGR04086 family membrane protein [Thermanaeromonas toyohensis]SMB97893.1 putative membrane protein, TIGR04086 family [Thermanaeromonas toyohensis ToBE]